MQLNQQYLPPHSGKIHVREEILLGLLPYQSARLPCAWLGKVLALKWQIVKYYTQAGLIGSVELCTLNCESGDSYGWHVTDERNRSDTLSSDWVWSGLSKAFRSRHRHLRPSCEKAFKQPPKQPPALLLRRLIWSRTPLPCYFKHTVSLLLNQKIGKKKNKKYILKYDALPSATDTAKEMALYHGPGHQGKPRTHLVTLSVSDPLIFRGKKPLGSLMEMAAGVGTHNRDSRYPQSYCAASADVVWIRRTGVREHNNLKNWYLLLHDSGLGSYGTTNKYLRALQNVIVAVKILMPFESGKWSVFLLMYSDAHSAFIPRLTHGSYLASWFLLVFCIFPLCWGIYFKHYI